MSAPGETERPAPACLCCGNCCRVEGYVHVGAAEVDRLAEFMGLSVEEFTREFTRLTGDRQGLSLAEQAGGACVFLDADNYCLVEPVKPEQCRGFPHAWRFSGFERVCAAAIASARRN